MRLDIELRMRGQAWRVLITYPYLPDHATDLAAASSSVHGGWPS